MSLSRWSIRVISVAASALTVALFDFVRHQWFPGVLHPEPFYGSLILLAAVFIVAYGMTEGFFWLFRRERRSLLFSAAELAALNSIFRETATASGKAGDTGERALSPLLARLSSLMDARASLMYLVAEDGASLYFAEGTGIDRAQAQGVYPDGLAGAGAPPADTAHLAERVDLWVERVGLRERLRDLGYHSVTSVPLLARERLLGVVVLAGDRLPPVYYRDRELQAILGKQLGSVIDSARLMGSMQRKEEQARELSNLSVELSGRMDAEEIRRLATERSRVLLRADLVALCTVASDTSQQLITTYSPAPPPDAAGSSAPCFLLTRSKDDASRGHESHEAGELACPILAGGARSVHLSAPLVSGGETLGVLCMARAEGAPTAEERRLLNEVASRTAMALYNAWLHQHVQDLAVIEERDRIAREMHDSLAQVLGFVNLKAQTALSSLNGGASPVVKKDLQEISEAAQDAYVDVREAILGLRESRLVGSERTLGEVLRSYLEKYQRQTGIAATLEAFDENGARFPPHAEVQLVRIIQEALTNVRKHAGASKVHVSICHEGSEAVVSVEDDGAGFNALEAQRKGFGLTSMRERAEEIGGRLEIDSHPGTGTRVVARLPIS